MGAGVDRVRTFKMYNFFRESLNFDHTMRHAREQIILEEKKNFRWIAQLVTLIFVGSSGFLFAR